MSDSSDSACRLCGTAPEGMAQILSACPALAQTRYLARHDAVLKVLFFEIIFNLGLIDTVPPWYSPIKPQSVYETAEVQAYWDVPVYGEYQELRANRVNARIVNNRDKQVIALEMSCPWVRSCDKKTSEVCTTQMRTEVEIPRVQDQPVQHHLRCTRGMVQGLGCHSTAASRQQS